MRPFSIYPGAMDDDTLLLARADSGWLRGESAKGPDFTNHGATPSLASDGWRFVRDDADYMSATFDGQPVREQLTLECWVRDYTTLVDQAGYIATHYIDASNYLYLYASRQSTPTISHIRVLLRVGDVQIAIISWSGQEVDDLLASAEWWHVAAVVNGTDWLKLFVNGIERGSQPCSALLEGNYTFHLGNTRLGAPTRYLSAVLDEVRISKVARYSADFPITRFGEGRRALKRGPGVEAGLCAGIIG